MKTYLVESYWPGVTAAAVADAIARIGALGQEVRCTDSTLVSEDEIVLSVCTGPSHARVRVCVSCAGLPFERIVECVRVTEGQDRRFAERGRTSASRSAT